MTQKAISRRLDVVSRVEGDETLVLDLQTQTAHCLSGDVAGVWNADESSVAAIAACAGLSESAVEAAVATLVVLGLVSASAGMSRRTLVMRGAVVGGAVVTTIALPTAAMASSNIGPVHIALSPTSGVSGSTGTLVTVTGGGFKTTNGQIASVTIYGIAVTPSNTTITNGNVNFTFTVPPGVPLTTVTVTVKDNAGTPNQASAVFTVTGPPPAVTLSATTFPKNSTGSFTVTATTRPFAPNSQITVTPAGNFNTVTSNPVTVLTDINGIIPSSATFQLTYNSGASKTGTLTFSDAAGNSTVVNVQTSA